ncbi:MAG: alpha-amylase family glycosyl hydrolase [Melioribacteraceae bacterium]|nr:alpha-amylase family glycosyl hydrolase [Melioribacteraceae bacterium]
MKIRVFFLYFFTVITLSAQVVVTVPEFATENDSIKIIFNAQEAEWDNLVGYTGNVYTHTGVKTNLGDWKYVIGDWGNNTAQPQLTRIGTDLYELVIGYPRTFYSVTNPAEKILQMNFVFRSADASKQTEDIFVPLYEAGPNVKINQPSGEVNFAIVGDLLEIIAKSTNADLLQLFVDGVEVSNTVTDSVNYELNITERNRYEIIATASDAGRAVASDTVYVISRDEIVLEDLPDDVEFGINYTSQTSAVLALHAPFKEFVYVIGDFNNWSESPESEMKLTPDSSTWWIDITGLTPGQQYAFQYNVEGNLRIADPYTQLVLDPNNDPWISSNTYPNLLPYPYGKTSELVSVLQPAKPEYQWANTSYSKPQKTNLIIYELLIRDFLAAHDYETLIDTLDYLQNLGINAIELMPINEFEGNESWGYNPSFYFAPDKYYGPEEDLKAFIDECHSRGIAVIIDMVLNHSYGQSPMVRLYFDRYASDEIISLPESPWFNVQSPNQTYKWGADFNHESQYTKEFVDRVNRYWLTEFKVDGFRFDFTKGFTNKPGDGWAYDATRIAILKRMADAIWQTNPSAYVILEHLTDNSEERELANYGMLLWGNMNYNYSEAAMGYHDSGKSNFSGVSYKQRGWTVPHLVGYMESHDEERLMYKNLQYGNSSGNYDIQELNIALNRIKLVSSFFLTVPGPKMIWQFGELGYDISIDDPCRVCNKPILWNYFQVETRKNLYKTFSALILLKNNYSIFSTDDFSMNVSTAFKKIHLNENDDHVVIAGNFGVTETEGAPQFQTTGWWYDYFGNDSLYVEDVNMMMNFDPGEFHIYSTEKFPDTEEDIISNIHLSDESIPMEFRLNQNYPNPFNPTTTITFSIPATGKKSNTFQKVRLDIYNTLGQRIKTLVNEQKAPGNYHVQFDASGLASGIYFYQLSSDNFVLTNKMVLMK